MQDVQKDLEMSESDIIEIGNSSEEIATYEPVRNLSSENPFKTVKKHRSERPKLQFPIEHQQQESNYYYYGLVPVNNHKTGNRVQLPSVKKTRNENCQLLTIIFTTIIITSTLTGSTGYFYGTTTIKPCQIVEENVVAYNCTKNLEIENVEEKLREKNQHLVCAYFRLKEKPLIATPTASILKDQKTKQIDWSCLLSRVTDDKRKEFDNYNEVLKSIHSLSLETVLENYPDCSMRNQSMITTTTTPKSTTRTSTTERPRCPTQSACPACKANCQVEDCEKHQRCSERDVKNNNNKDCVANSIIQSCNFARRTSINVHCTRTIESCGIPKTNGGYGFGYGRECGFGLDCK